MWRVVKVQAREAREIKMHGHNVLILSLHNFMLQCRIQSLTAGNSGMIVLILELEICGTAEQALKENENSLIWLSDTLM